MTGREGMQSKINPNDYGLVIVSLRAHEQAEIPKGWAIRDTVTGLYRGCDIEGDIEPLFSGRAWVKYPIGAWRGKTRAKAIAEARQYVVESGVEPLNPREVKYFRYFKPWSPWRPANERSSANVREQRNAGATIGCD